MTRLVAALVLILPALWPLLRAGFFISDDGQFHVYRIAALADAWQHGVLYPRLFPGFGFGYGQAVLNFYAPLAYVPGALLAALGLSPTAVAELTIALGFVLAALAAYGYACSLWGATGGTPLALRGEFPCGELAGCLAAAAYTYFPYHLADAYVRGAIPEHFAFIWPPLILWAYTSAFREARPWKPLLWGALAWAGLTYTHNLTALLMVAPWIAYILVMAAWTRRWRRLGPAVGSVILAAALSAPLWLPFLAESRYVGLASGPSDGYRQHLAPLNLALQTLPFYRYRGPQSGLADHPLSWLMALLFLTILALLIWRLVTRRPAPNLQRTPHDVGGAATNPARCWRGCNPESSAPVAGFGLLLIAASAFMTTAASLPVWRMLEPILANLQYPWRFLVMTAVGAMIAAGALPSLIPQSCQLSRSWQLCQNARGDDFPGLVRPGRGSRPVSASTSRGLRSPGLVRGRSTGLVRAILRTGGLAAFLLALIVQPLVRVPSQPLAISAADAWAPDRMWREDAATGQVGATWTGEFLPLTVQEQRWALGRPAEADEAGQDGLALSPRPSVRIERLGYDQIELTLETTSPLTVRLHQFHLPMWQAYVNGERVPTFSSGDLGLVSADVAQGTGRLAFRFGPSPAWVASGVLALLAAVGWAYLAWRDRRSDRSRNRDKRWSVWASLGLVVLVAGLGLNGIGIGQQMRSTPQPAQTALDDVALLIGYDVAPARGANALDVTLYWFALRETSQNYKTFVHLIGPDGGVIAQHDGDPVGGYTPTTRWLAGELIADRHRIPYPANLAPGEYHLKAGMYQPEPLLNLATDPPTPDNRVDLGAVRYP